MKKNNIIFDYLWISISAILTAIAVNNIFIFSGLAPGGITGLSLIFSTITGISVDVMSLCISLPLLVIGVLLLGKSFGIKTLFITIATPICMKFVPMVYIADFLPAMNPIVELSICAIIGGLLVGSAIGIALNRQCATGGTDLLSLIINHFIPALKLSAILLVLDGFVVIASGVITQNAMIAVFSFISLLIIIQTITFITKNQLGMSADLKQNA